MRTRIQICVGNKLIAEAVVESDSLAYQLWHRWCWLRHGRNESTGCSAISKADASKLWNVKVGSIIPESKKN